MFVGFVELRGRFVVVNSRPMIKRFVISLLLIVLAADQSLASLKTKDYLCI